MTPQKVINGVRNLPGMLLGGGGIELDLEEVQDLASFFFSVITHFYYNK